MWYFQTENQNKKKLGLVQQLSLFKWLFCLIDVLIDVDHCSETDVINAGVEDQFDQCWKIGPRAVAELDAARQPQPSCVSLIAVAASASNLAYWSDPVTLSTTGWPTHPYPAEHRPSEHSSVVLMSFFGIFRMSHKCINV